MHNHPNNSNPSGFTTGDKSGDKFAADFLINSHSYRVERYVYQPKTGRLVAYDEKGILGAMPWRLIFTPSTVRILPVLPEYPGVGLPPL